MGAKTYEMTILFDFFSDFLTEKQREYFDLYYNEDLSLSEIADNFGITRQGVRDIIVRAENTLLEVAEKTGLIKRYYERGAEIEKAQELVGELLEISNGDAKISGIAHDLSAILSGLKG